MSDEEKKAIEYVKNIKSWWWDNSPNRIYSINRTDIEQFDIVLNLTEKQSKEIEELRDKCKKKNKTIETMQFIKALQRSQENICLITEEQCAVKNKYMVEVSNGEFVDVNELYSIWKSSVSVDKIKAKIEEIDKHITDMRNIARKSTDKVECRLLNDDINEYFKAKSVLQSLLEKE